MQLKGENMNFAEILKSKAKEGKVLDENGKKAKLDVLKELISEMSELQGGDLDKGLKEVTVSSDSAEGLEEGLEMAGEMVESGDIECEADELGAEVEGELSGEDEDDKEARIAKLEAELAALRGESLGVSEVDLGE